MLFNVILLALLIAAAGFAAYIRRGKFGLGLLVFGPGLNARYAIAATGLVLLSTTP